MLAMARAGREATAKPAFGDDFRVLSKSFLGFDMCKGWRRSEGGHMVNCNSNYAAKTHANDAKRVRDANEALVRSCFPSWRLTLSGPNGKEYTSPDGLSAISTTTSSSPESTLAETSAYTSAPKAAADLCVDIRKVLGQGQKETPPFSSFYASAVDKTKYAGKASVQLSGFGDCDIQQSARPPGRLSPVFASFACKATRATAADNAALATETSNKIAACLPNSYYVAGNDMGHSIKTHAYALTLDGFPRVVVRQTDGGVSIHLDTKGP
jgi:hypothetical protein